MKKQLEKQNDMKQWFADSQILCLFFVGEADSEFENDKAKILRRECWRGSCTERREHWNTRVVTRIQICVCV